MSKIKLLLLSNKFPYPPKDGGAIAKFNLIKGLKDFDVDLTVLAINTSKHYFNTKELPDEIERLATFESVYVNTRVSSIGLIRNLLFSTLPYNAVRFISKKFKSKLIALLQKNSYDIVQLEGLYLCPYIDTIRRYSQAKIFYRAHNIEHEIWERTARETKQKAKRFYLKKLSKRIRIFELSFINKYDALIPITERDETYLNCLGNNKPSLVCPTGIEMEEFNFPSSSKSNVSLFHIGGLDWPPNQLGLIWFFENVWKKLSKNFPGVKFHLAGRNPGKKFVAKIKKYRNVVYEGEVDNAKEFMSAHTIMIVPLLSGSGMRIKIIEGMALGKAIISTKIGAEGIPCSNKKDIYIANTADEFYSIIENLINNVELVEKIGGNAKKLVRKEFNNKNITASLVEFYRQHI